MKLLFVAPSVYGHRVGTGGGALCFEVLRRLAEVHEILFLGFVASTPSEAELACIEDLEAHCRRVVTVPRSPGRGAALYAKMRLVFGLRPFDAVLRDLPAMRENVASLVRHECPDAVILQFPWMAQYVECCPSVPVVMDVQDAFSVSAFRAMRAERRFVQKVGKLLNWLSWIKYEAKYYQQCDRVVALTEQDRYGLKVFSPGLDAVVSPAAVECDVGRADRPQQYSNRILFFGSFHHAPNQDAVQYFLSDIFAAIKERCPQVEFHVVGKGLAKDRLGSGGVQLIYHGFVEDLRDFVRSAAVVVVPLRYGGGIKIKVLEAMAVGSAIVSTSIGAEETGAEDGTHMIIRDDSLAFARAVSDMLLSPERRAIIGENARRLVQEKFSWQAKMTHLSGVLDEVVAAQKNGAALTARP